MEHALRVHTLEAWYPRAIDYDYGGFLTDLSYCWEPRGVQQKMIVSQARHVWTLSKAAMLYPERTDYLAAATHGFRYLQEVFWDDAYGGFHAQVRRDGTLMTGSDDGWLLKTAYGNAFGIFGLAAYYGASKDPSALQLAQDAFHYLERGSHDAVQGGYFQYLERSGKPMREGFGSVPPKDQNSSIHLLEALAELYAVWPDALVRTRLSELMLLIRDIMVTPAGYLKLFFEADWTPVSLKGVPEEADYLLDHVSFGHDVETAFLLLDAARLVHPGGDPDTTRIAQRMVDHGLAFGWDRKEGGFFDRGFYFPGSDAPRIITDTKVWWAQAEGLNTLLIMADRFSPRYASYFEALWQYAKTYLIDEEHGGWYWGGLDMEPEQRTKPKGNLWKSSYHTARSLMRCIRRLRWQDDQ